MKFYFRFFLLLLLSFSLSQNYGVGEQISEAHQNTQFNICYGAEEHGFGGQLVPSLSLGDFNGFNNGGIFYVLMIDMAASW